MTREEAVHLLKNTAWLGTEERLQQIEQAIETLKPQTGKWIEQRWVGSARCSACRKVVALPLYFCPYCGADMRGEE